MQDEETFSSVKNTRVIHRGENNRAPRGGPGMAKLTTQCYNVSTYQCTFQRCILRNNNRLS